MDKGDRAGTCGGAISRRRMLAAAAAAPLLGLGGMVPRAWAGRQEADAAAVFAEAGLGNAAIGWLLVDPLDGRVLAEQAADRALIPASAAKLATVLAALAVLGPGHRFETTLRASGRVRGGTVDGDLWLVGGGDPLLFGDHLQALVRALHDQGLHRVTGTLHYDESCCAAAPQISPQQPVAAPYNTGISALSIDFNRVSLAWRRRADGRLDRVVMAVSDGLRQPADWIGVAPLATNPGPGILYLPDGAAPAEGWLLSPALPERGTVWLPVRTPGYHTAMFVRALLAADRIALAQPQPETVPGNATVLAGHVGEPLPAVAQQVLRFSNNLSAELLGLATSRALTGTVLAPTASAAALSQWWQTALPAVDWTGWEAETHSGLSAAGRATPRQLALLLTAAMREPQRFGGTDLFGLLPSIALDAADSDDSGDDGDGAAAGPVRAKSGTLDFTSALAGYLVPPGGGRRLAFAILIADLERMAALAAQFDPRVTVSPPGARAWAGRARAAQRALLRRWLALA